MAALSETGDGWALPSSTRTEHSLEFGDSKRTARIGVNEQVTVGAQNGEIAGASNTGCLVQRQRLAMMHLENTLATTVQEA